MDEFAVMYDHGDVIICRERDVDLNICADMKVYGHADSEEDAERLAERCEYDPHLR